MDPTVRGARHAVGRGQAAGAGHVRSSRSGRGGRHAPFGPEHAPGRDGVGGPPCGGPTDQEPVARGRDGLGTAPAPAPAHGPDGADHARDGEGAHEPQLLQRGGRGAARLHRRGGHPRRADVADARGVRQRLPRRHGHGGRTQGGGARHRRRPRRRSSRVARRRPLRCRCRRPHPRAGGARPAHDQRWRHGHRPRPSGPVVGGRGPEPGSARARPGGPADADVAACACRHRRA